MANKRLWLGMLVIALVFGMTVIGCKSSSELPISSVYRGVDVQGNTYVLNISEGNSRSAKAGDSYVLTITYRDGTKETSRGRIEAINDDGTFTLQPSITASGTDASTFTIVISGEEIMSVTGEIVTAEGKIIVPPTFSFLYLRANRWGKDGPGEHSGHQWSSYLCINLSDVVGGRLKTGGKYSITISGEVDMPLYNTDFEAWLVPSGKTIQWMPSNEFLGYSTNLNEISRGTFQKTYTIDLNPSFNFDNQGNHIVMLQLIEKFYYKYDGNLIEDFGSIPDHIPQGQIMATIKNFDISITEIN